MQNKIYFTEVKRESIKQTQSLNSKPILSHTKPYKSLVALSWKKRERIYKEKRNNVFNKNPWKNKKVCKFLRENKQKRKEI